MKTKHYKADLCVVGGGLAGLCCAIAAARHGIKVVLVHDRPVPGGNASSEVRMWICGAHGKDMRETGIIEELELENFYRNPTLNYSVWDGILYEKAMFQDGLTVLLNTACMDAETDGDHIKSIKAWQSNAETYHIISAKYFADCSGDAILAPLSGAKFMYGREAKRDFDETIPPDEPDQKTMGMSCLFQIRETDHPVPFIPPAWAYTYPTDDDLPYKKHTLDYNFWWIEIGGEWDCVHDTDRCREELLKIAYGVWDHVKNQGDHGADNWTLEWIGFLPGKRESRRYIGKTIVTENDVRAGGNFDDTVAYGGWTMDDHFPAGFYHKDSYPTIHHPAPSPWALPLRCMISENINNLVFAGRNISVTHAALSSSRVMATCAVLGQALGTAVALAIGDGCAVENVDIKKLQQTLLADDCYLPRRKRAVSPLSLRAACSDDIVRNGVDRGEENCHIGGAITYTLDKDTPIRAVRLIFDSDLNRGYKNMPCCYPLHETKYKLPQTLVRAYRIECEDSKGNIHTVEVTDNRQRFVRHEINCTACTVRFVPLATHGCEEFRVFNFEIE